MSIFGGNTGITYEQLQQRKKIAEQLQKSAMTARPRDQWEGLGAVVDALLARHNQGKFDKGAAEFRRTRGDDDPLVQALYLGSTAPITRAVNRGDVPQYARGTNYHPGGLAIVGEEGPELAVLPRGSKVIPNGMAWTQGTGQQLPLTEGQIPPDPMGNPLLEEDQSRFDDANAYQVAQADTGTMTDAQPFDGKAAAAGLDLNVTQAQRSGQALRLLQAESILRELEQQGGRVGQGMLEWLPDGLENMLVDEDYGRFQQARDAFAEAAMRADTGATINESEWPRILKNLMPRPGDGPERIAQRRAAREVFIHSLMMSSGEAAAAMPEIGKPVVPVKPVEEMSDDEFMQWLQTQGASQ